MSPKNDFRAVSVCLLSVAILFIIYFLVPRATGNSDTIVSASTESSLSAADPTSIDRHSAWQVEKIDDPYTGVMTATAMNILDGDNSIVVRQREGKLECYINAGKFLERINSTDSRHSMIRYRFDNGADISQMWTISDDNKSLVYPGDPKEFLSQLAAAKTFAFEFTPAGSVSQNVAYDVAGFPMQFQ